MRLDVLPRFGEVDHGMMKPHLFTLHSAPDCPSGGRDRLLLEISDSRSQGMIMMLQFLRALKEPAAASAVLLLIATLRAATAEWR